MFGVVTMGELGLWVLATLDSSLHSDCSPNKQPNSCPAHFHDPCCFEDFVKICISISSLPNQIMIPQVDDIRILLWSPHFLHGKCWVHSSWTCPILWWPLKSGPWQHPGEPQSWGKMVGPPFIAHESKHQSSRCMQSQLEGNMTKGCRPAWDQLFTHPSYWPGEVRENKEWDGREEKTYALVFSVVTFRFLGLCVYLFGIH